MFHKDHDVIDHNSSSFLSSLSIIWRASMKKFSAIELLFCNLPRTTAQTLWANGHSYRMCSFVSSCWLQMEHLGSVCTFHWVGFDFVGRTLQQALHINVRTLGGTFRDHNRFHKRWSCASVECSLKGERVSLRALALENFNTTLFYNSKKSLYHHTIPFYNISTFQTSTSSFYSLK